MATAYIADGIRGRRMDRSEMNRLGDAPHSNSPPVSSTRSGSKFFFLWVTWFGASLFVFFFCIGGVSGVFHRISSALSTIPLRRESVGRFFCRGWGFGMVV